MEVIIQLFAMFNLNSNKHLNFLAFQRAFLLYTGWKASISAQQLEQIEQIRSTMNTKRTDFSLPKGHNIVITPNWFLGFLSLCKGQCWTLQREEGDGSFTYKKNSQNVFFNLGQKGNKDLLLAIADFLHKRKINNNVLVDLSIHICKYLGESSFEGNQGEYRQDNSWVILSSLKGFFILA